MKRVRHSNAFVAALRAFVLWSAVFGFAYTLAMTGLAQLFFPRQANGSLLKTADGRRVCELLGQDITRPDLFHGRVTAANLNTFFADDGTPLFYGAPSNKSPATQDFAAAVKARVAAQRKLNPDALGPVPADLVTNSGSGTDPHITVAAAEWQIPRVAKATGKSPDALRALLARCTEGRFLGVWGQPRVNVVKANLLLLGVLY